MSITLPDPVQLLDSLNVEQLRQRIADLEAESKAFRVLLRSALARDRELRRRNATSLQTGGAHVS
jgi:hypothetical protein